MIKILKTSSILLFSFVYLVSISPVLAQEMVTEIITDIPTVEEVTLPIEPASESMTEMPVTSEITWTNNSPTIDTPPSSETSTEIILPSADIPVITPESGVWTDSPETTDTSLVESVFDEILESAPTTEEIFITEPVMVEENSVFTPPGPEPEPWQPPVVVDPTTDNVPVWNIETHSDPQFLAENSVFVRRMAEEVWIDVNAKHSCKVDVFHTDVSEQPTWLLSVRFYGTSLLTAYEAEIGSLPNGIDVRFEKNNDYIYDFRGKETVLELVVIKQDNSLSGDFTIPIIYTQKGKKESSVICQLNIINETEQVPVSGIIPPEPVRDPAQEFVIQFLEDALPAATPEELIESLILIPSINDASDTAPDWDTPLEQWSDTPKEPIESLVPVTVTVTEPVNDIPPTVDNHLEVPPNTAILEESTPDTPEELIESLVPVTVTEPVNDSLVPTEDDAHNSVDPIPIIPPDVSIL